MKNIILSFLLLFAVVDASAQLDRSIRPQPAPERPIKIGKAKTFTMKNGMTVIVVSNSKLPRVSFRLFMDRKPLNEGDQAGIADMLGGMLTEGTLQRTKAELDEEIDFMGANLSAYAGGASASGLSKYKEKLISLLAEVVREPSWPQESFDKLVNQSKSGIESSKDDPGSISSNLLSTVLYGKEHPYGQFMTTSSLENVSLQDVKGLYANWFSPVNSYLTIVGDIKKKEAKKLVKKYFGDWEATAVKEEMPEMPAQIDANEVHIVDRPSSVQSVVKIAHVIDLKPETSDHMAMRVMNQILGGGGTARLYKNLREDKGYTYGSYSRFSSSLYVGRFLATVEARNEVTDSSITEILTEIQNMASGLVTDDELNAAKESLKGSFGRSLERPATISGFALNTIRYGLDDKYYENYLINLDAVSKEDIQRVAQKYLGGSGYYITVVGKSSEIASSLEKFGPLTYHDFEGNITDPPVQLPEGVTAETIIEDYISAVGGREKLMGLASIRMKREGTVQGFTLKSEEVYSGRDKAYMLQDMGPMGRIEMIRNGVEITMKQNGNEMPVPEDQQASMRAGLAWMPELEYSSRDDVQIKASGMGEVGGRPAYILEVRIGEEVTNDFFDTETGLKLRSQESAEGPDGSPITQNTDFLSYEDRGGIQLPTQVSVPLGPGMSITFELKEAVIDGSVENSLFD